MAIKFVCLLFVVGLVAQVHAKLDGAPRESCNDMIPQHGTPPQKGASPFVVQVSNTAVRAGEKIKIKIGGSTTFKGFLVQARDANGQKIGTFTATQSNVSKAIQCDSANDSLTHTAGANGGVSELTAEWTAPNGFNGPVTFYSTVAQNGGTFWVGIPSEQVLVQ